MSGAVAHDSVQSTVRNAVTGQAHWRERTAIQNMTYNLTAKRRGGRRGSAPAAEEPPPCGSRRRESRSAPLFAAVVELATVAIGELEAVDGETRRSSPVEPSARSRPRARDAGGESCGAAPGGPGCAPRTTCTTATRGHRSARRHPGSGATSSGIAEGRGDAGLERATDRAGRSRPAPRAQASRFEHGTPHRERVERAAVGPGGDGGVEDVEAVVREHAGHRREQPGPVTGRDLDAPFEPIDVGSTETRASLARGQRAPTSAACRAMSGASCARRYARGRVLRPCRATYLSSPTMRSASARRRSTRFRASRPVTSGWSSRSRPGDAARRAARAPRASARRARASAGRAHVPAPGCSRWIAIGYDALPPRGRRASAPRRATGSESPTSSAISCSAAAPRSRRCTMRRASCDRGRVLADRVEDQRGKQQPIGVLRAAACSAAAAAGSVATISRIRSTRVKRNTCDGSRRNGSRCRRSTASASSGSARSSTPVVSRKRHAADVAAFEHREQLAW